MEKAIKHQIDELSRCRADYSALFKNFKQARVIYEEKDQLSAAQLQLVRTKNEAFEKKLELQKRAISSHKQARRGFENDVNQLKYATELLEARERCIHDKHEGVAAENHQMKLDAKAQVDIVSELHTIIEKLNFRITNETVPKVALDRLSSEIEVMKRIMKEEMVSLETHQNMKEKYANLQCRVEWEMIPLVKHEATAASVNALIRKLEGSVPRQEFALLLDKYQKCLSENAKSEESLKCLILDKEVALQESSESRLKFLALQSHLLQIEKELSATRLSGIVSVKDIQQLKKDVKEISDQRQQLKEKNQVLETASVEIVNQLENMKLSLNKELHNVRHLEQTIQAMAENTEKERQYFQKESHSFQKGRAEELIKMDFNVEAEKLKSYRSLEAMKALHSEEINVYQARLDQQVLLSSADIEVMRHAIESMHLSQIESMKESEKKRIQELTNVHHNHEISIAKSYSNEISTLKAGHVKALDTLILDRQQYLENALQTLQLKHTEEFSTIITHHYAELETLKKEVRESEILKGKMKKNYDVERTRADKAEASLEHCQTLLAKLSVNSKIENKKVNRIGNGHRNMISGNGHNIFRYESFDLDHRGQGEMIHHDKHAMNLLEVEVEVEVAVGRKETSRDGSDKASLQGVDKDKDQYKDKDKVIIKEKKNIEAKVIKKEEEEAFKCKIEDRDSEELQQQHRYPLAVRTPICHTGLQVSELKPEQKQKQKQKQELSELDDAMVTVEDEHFSDSESENDNEEGDLMSWEVSRSRSLENCSYKELLALAAKGSMKNTPVPVPADSSYPSLVSPLVSLSSAQSPQYFVQHQIEYEGTNDDLTCDIYSSFPKHPNIHSADQLLPLSFHLPLSSDNAVAIATPTALTSNGAENHGAAPSAYPTSSEGSLMVTEAPNHFLIRQLRLTAYRNGHTIPHLNGDISMDPNSNTRQSIYSDVSDERKSSYGLGLEGSTSYFGESLEFSPPHFSTSPVVSPHQSMNQALSPIRRHSQSSAYSSNEESFTGSHQMSGLPHTTQPSLLSPSPSPSASSREKLLERLISLTKDTSVMTPVEQTLTVTPPL